MSVQPIGGESLMNATTAGVQRGWPESLRAASSDSAGTYAVTWSSEGQDGSDWGVFARLYDALTGEPIADEFAVNQFTDGAQLASTIAMEVTGAFVVAWASDGAEGHPAGIYARLFNAFGQPASDEFLVGETIESVNTFPSIAMSAYGDFVVTWQDSSSGGAGWEVLARAFDRDGSQSSGVFHVNTTTAGDQTNPSVAVVADDSFAIAWTAQDSSGTGVQMRFFDFGANALTAELPVNEEVNGNQVRPSVATVDGGTVAVGWTSELSVNESEIVARVFATDGMSLTGDLQVSQSAGKHAHASVAGNGDGVFAVAWTRPGIDGSDEGVLTRAFSRSGSPRSDESLVNDFTTLDQGSPSISFGSLDEFAVSWTSFLQDGDGSGVYARRFAVSDTRVTDAGGPYLIDEGAPLQLDASGSFDPDSGELSYAWDLDSDGDFNDATGVQPLISAENLGLLGIVNEGDYVVRLRVADADGNAGYAKSVLQMANQAPLDVIVDHEMEVVEGTLFAIQGSFVDGGRLDSHTVTIDWGDGTQSMVTPAVGVRNFSATHTYADDSPTGTAADPYTILVVLADDSGAIGEGTSQVTVVNANPTITQLTLSTEQLMESRKLLGDGPYTRVTLPNLLQGATGINNDGDIIGGNPLGFLRRANGVLETISFPGRSQTVPLGINNVGQIVGDTIDESGHFRRGFIRQPNGTYEDFDVPSFGGFQVNDINDLGQILGVRSTGMQTSDVFIRQPNGKLEFLQIPGVNRPAAYGINNDGLISGQSEAGSFVYDPRDGSIAIVDYPGAADTQVFGINNLGQIAGFGFDRSGAHGFVRNPDGTLIEVNISSARPWGINDFGELVGGTQSGSFAAAPNATPAEKLSINGSIVDSGEFDTHTVTVDWGDGTQFHAAVDPLTRTFLAEHVYRDDPQGTSAAEQYAFTVHVTDNDLATAETVRHVTVENAAPTVTIAGSPVEAFANTPIQLMAIATDSGSLDTFSFDWEVTLDGATVLEASGPTLSFTPTAPGDHAISLVGTDDDGGVGTTQATLTITICDVSGDSDGDCDIDLDDLNQVRNHFGESGLGVIDLPFTASVPGTIWDKDGVGTGLTHRLPGTGGGLPLVDLNLDLSPGTNGKLFVKSTDASPGAGANLDQLEAVGVIKAGLDQSDFDLKATLLDVPAINSNGELTNYAGTSWNKVVRVGFRDSNSYEFVINRGSGDEVLYSSAANAFATGDDVTLTLSRRGGLWSVAWQNATTPAASGKSPAFDLDWLNGADDLHLGVLHAAPGSLTHQTATIDRLSMDLLEPLAGDANGDFVVDLADLNAVRNNFGASTTIPMSSPPTAPRSKVYNSPERLDRNAVDAVFGQLAAAKGEWIVFPCTNRRLGGGSLFWLAIH